MAMAIVIQPGLLHAWATGIFLSALCLILQAVLSSSSRSALRHVDQKIIIQLSVARLMLSFLQYALNTNTYSIFHSEPFFVDALWAISYYIDAVVVCWTCFYYKNLRDQELSMIPLQKWNFETLSLVIWLFTLLVGVWYAIFLFNMKCLKIYKLVFGTAKVIVMVITVCFYFILMMTCGKTNRRNSAVFRKCVSFLLVCLMTMEVVISTYFTASETVTFGFYVLNSFHVLALTLIFVIPAETLNEVQLIP